MIIFSPCCPSKQDINLRDNVRVLSTLCFVKDKPPSTPQHYLYCRWDLEITHLMGFRRDSNSTSFGEKLEPTLLWNCALIFIEKTTNHILNLFWNIWILLRNFVVPFLYDLVFGQSSMRTLIKAAGTNMYKMAMFSSLITNILR